MEICPTICDLVKQSYLALVSIHWCFKSSKYQGLLLSYEITRFKQDEEVKVYSPFASKFKQPNQLLKLVNDNPMDFKDILTSIF